MTRLKKKERTIHTNTFLHSQAKTSYTLVTPEILA